jgi:hypothetical protein
MDKPQTPSSEGLPLAIPGDMILRTRDKHISGLETFYTGSTRCSATPVGSGTFPLTVILFTSHPVMTPQITATEPITSYTNISLIITTAILAYTGTSIFRGSSIYSLIFTRKVTACTTISASGPNQPK